MTTGMPRRLPGISRPGWQVLAVGGVVALWFLVVLTGTAQADDCLEYVKNARNFVTIPRGLLEDCMRTGVVQALVTSAVAGVGGATIAAAVNKAIKDAQQGKEVPGPDVATYRDGREGPPKDNPFDPTTAQRRKKWEDEKLVWDPQDLGWRKPRPDEYPPPEDPPEEPPPFQKQNPRTQTPPECLGLYDDYVKAQARLLALEPQMDKLGTDLRLAQDWLQLKLGIFTAQFAVDLTDFFQLGTGVVRAAGPISQALGGAGSIGTMARAAAGKAAALAKAVAELLRELAELGAKAAKLRTAARVLKEAAQVLGKHADELAEGVLALNKQVAANRRLLAVAGEVEGLIAGKRGAIVAKLMDAEKRLKAAELFWQRKQQLQRWAEGERASITAEQARLALAAQAELDAVNDELRTLSARIAQSPEVTDAARRTSRATTTLHDVEERILQLEAHAKELSAKVEALRKPFELKRAFLKAEDTLDTASQVLDALDAKIRGLRDELDRLGSSPNMPSLKQKERAAFEQFEDAKANWKGEAGYYKDAEKRRNRINEEAEAGRLERGEDAPYTPDELAGMEEARQYEARCRQAMEDAKRNRDFRKKEWEMADAALKDEVDRVHGLNAQDVERVKGQLAATEATRPAAEAAKEQALLDHEAASKALQPYSHPGMGNVDDFPDMEEELTLVRQELRSKRSEHAAARQEFDKAYDAEAQVKAQLEAGSRPALDARKAEAEAKLKRANRSWQEVAAEENPAEFQQWKLEVEGTDPFNEGPNELRPLQEEVLNLRKQEAEVEKEINAKRDQLGSESQESLRRKIAQDEDAVVRKRQEAEAAREKANAQQAEADHADKAAADAEAEYAAKDAEVKNAQAQHKQAEAEAAKESQELPPPVDPSAGPGSGTLDVIDQLTKRSHDLSQQVKPGWAAGTEDVLRRVAGAFGERWNRYFDGQSPDEVANALKKSRDKVIRLRGELDAMTEEYDKLRAQLKTLKPQLDQCVQQHTYWTGPTVVKE